MARGFTGLDGAGWRPSPRLLLRVAEVVLAALLVLQGVRLVQAVLRPPPGFSAAPTSPGPRADLSMLERFDPFFRAAPGMSAGAASSLGGLRLFGVRVEAGGRGSAILGSDVAQSSFVVGEEVQPGVTLAAVAADHVILAQGGQKARLEFGAVAPSPAAVAAAQMAPVPPAAPTTPAPPTPSPTGTPAP